MWIYQLKTLAEGRKSCVSEEWKCLQELKKDGLLSEATYLFIFSFGNVGGKATILWLPALRRENKEHSESSHCKSYIDLFESLIPCCLKRGSGSSVEATLTYEPEFIIQPTLIRTKYKIHLEGQLHKSAGGFIRWKLWFSWSPIPWSQIQIVLWVGRWLKFMTPKIPSSRAPVIWDPGQGELLVILVQLERVTQERLSLLPSQPQ